MNNMIAKKGLTTEQLTIVNGEMDKKRKSKGVTYALWFFFGFFGMHRIYMGDVGYGILMLFLNWATFGIWMLVDVFLIGNRLEKKENELEFDLIQNVKSFNN